MDDETSKYSTESKEIKLNKSLVKRTINSFSQRQSSLDKAIASQQAIINTSMAAITRPSGLENAMRAFSSNQALINNSMAAITRRSGLENAMRAFSSNQALINNSMAAITRPSGLKNAMRAFASQQALISNSMTAIERPSALENAIQAFASQQALISNTIAAIERPSALDNAIQSFATASSAFLSDSSYLSEMAKVVSSVDMESVNASSIEQELENTESKFNLVENSKSFLRTFKSLPPWVQSILFFCLLEIILPQLNNISSNLLTPKVESYLESNDKTNRQKIKDIKKIPLTLNDIDTTDLRFITGSNVHLRAGPSTSTEVCDELVLGQIVTVLSKKRNWIEVMYEYEDGEYMSGWVFTRYTAKFEK
ncbi:SH3 domain-containing protein [Pseudoalteromonas gelatinilytica]